MTREEAEKYIKSKMCNDCSVHLGGGKCSDNCKVIEAIKALEQEPKTGHWILTDDDYVYCSECEDSYYPRPIDASWYYCPHCGAKMESEGKK